MMVKVEHVSKIFQSGRGRVAALSDISFSAGADISTAFIGKSGSGKTTLLNCMGGLLRPDTGTITFAGTPIHLLNRKEMALFQRQKLGFIFQYGNLLSYYTVFDNIAFPLILNGIGKSQREKQVVYLLERIGMTGAEKALPNELSGGEAQRVAAARAIAHSPQMLLADEPTASLDTETGRSLMELLFGMAKEQNCTLLFSTHDPELLGLCDQSFQIRDGKLLEMAK
jgi:ABC-type lipoprotein export system ATPase subunit